MPRFNRVPDEPASLTRRERITLDERFVSMLIPASPLDNVESQELRQLVMRALQELTPDELKVVEGRYQLKRSPGAVASHMGISHDEVKRLEQQALGKIRRPLVEYMEP